MTAVRQAADSPAAHISTLPQDRVAPHRSQSRRMQCSKSSQPPISEEEGLKSVPKVIF